MNINTEGLVKHIFIFSSLASFDQEIWWKGNRRTRCEFFVESNGWLYPRTHGQCNTDSPHWEEDQTSKWYNSVYGNDNELLGNCKTPVESSIDQAPLHLLSKISSWFRKCWLKLVLNLPKCFYNSNGDRFWVQL